MNKIILCEGQTDAILLSYYLGKVCFFLGQYQEARDAFYKSF